MCGIAGKINFDHRTLVTRGEIEAMLDPIVHRGPDSQGMYLDGPAGLGHCRLSIIDVGGGAQPMSNEDETIWIVFNGEIYNFHALREDLLARGHVFATRSDTEVIVHLYEEYGLECLPRLRGMFAFAIWDSRCQRLFVARDRVGIKPLYYSETSGAFSFASELKALLVQSDVSRDLDVAALRQFFSFFYLPGEETLFRSVRKLLPGHYLTVESGRVSTHRYWDLKFTDERWNHSFESVVEELHALLGETVSDHMIADVPVGVLLSGGVDSSAILSFAARGAGPRIKTFTVGFEGDGIVDERPFARLAAERFGAEHFEMTLTAEDFWQFLPDYVWHMEDPVCEPPATALHFVSRFASEQVKVLLSGEGGDEAFAGYPNYPNRLRLQRLERQLGPVAEFASGKFGRGRLAQYAAALGRPLDQSYYSRTAGPTTYFNSHATRIFSPEFLHATSSTRASETVAGILAAAGDRSLLDQMLYLDSKTWLPDDLLVKADNMTMATSLELRVPLLDHQVLEFAASLRPEHKVAGKETKRVLKAAFAKVLPTEILHRKKAGFPVPYSAWLRGKYAGRVRDLVQSSSAASSGLFQPAEIERLLKTHEETGRYAKEVFSLLVLELWRREFKPVPPRAFDVHSANGRLATSSLK
jgi:asparagine synthase (glutamine-hydrolysing)